jgi:predicted ATPase
MKQQGTEAKALLEPIYLRFTEGFATKDLVAARSLLTSLGAALATQ